MTTPDYPRRPTTYGADTDPLAFPQGDTATGDTSTGQSVSDAGRQVAGTAQDEAKNVASSAGEQAANVASEARDQTRNLLDQTMSEARSQTNDQMSRIGGKVRELASEMQQMASQSEQRGPAAHVVGDLAARGSDVADWLEGHGPEDLVSSVRRYARRSPVGFLVAAAGAGLVVGRLARAMQAGSPRSGAGVRQYGSQGYAGQGYGSQGYGGANPAGTPGFAAATSVVGEPYPVSGGTSPSPYSSEATTDPYGATGTSQGRLTTGGLGDETDLPKEGGW